MRKLVSSAAVLCAVLAPSAARAGLELGGRLGIGYPGGERIAGAAMTNVVEYTVPLQIDVNYRFTQVAVGGYLRYGAGKLDAGHAAACDGVSRTCRVADFAIGGQIDARLGAGPAGPWLGGYLGIETLRWSEAVGTGTFGLDLTGAEIGAQGGIDFAWGRLLLGPYAAISAGKYTTGTFYVGSLRATGSIASSAQATHTWVGVGVRGAFAL